MGKLSSKALAKLDEPDRYSDGDGLYLFVDSKQRRSWQLRYMIGGRRHDMAIGPERHFSLSQAREAAMKLRLTLIQGIDPLEERKAAEVAGTTFEEAAPTVHTARAAGWRNGKHKDQWPTTTASAITAGTNSGVSADFTGCRSCRRHVKSWLGQMSYRRATSQTVMPSPP